MQREYRQVIENIGLTKEEAQVLHDAEIVLIAAVDMLHNPECPYDQDLDDALKAGLEGLKRCNPRLNVDVILDL